MLVQRLIGGAVGRHLYIGYFATQIWSPAEYEQAEDHCHRIGQRGNVAAWYLLAKDTMDNQIYALSRRSGRPWTRQ